MCRPCCQGTQQSQDYDGGRQLKGPETMPGGQARLLEEVPSKFGVES